VGLRGAGIRPPILTVAAIVVAGVVFVVSAVLLANGRITVTAIASPSASPAIATIAATPSPTLEPTPSPSPTTAPTPMPTFPPLAEGVVPILYLHRVQATPDDWATLTPAQQATFLAYDVLPAAFAAQLDWLETHGYTTILPRDLARHWDRGTPLPQRPVIITLDDGFGSWTRIVLPLLQEHHMVAEFYMNVDAVARFQISWDQIRELARAGNGIGAHDVHHVQLTALGPTTRPASPSEMWFEVNQARIIIGRKIGTLPDSMAYVGGGFDATLVRLVRLAGYTTARSVLRGIDQARVHRFTLRVIVIGAHDDVIDVTTEQLEPGLPLFSAKMAGTRI